MKKILLSFLLAPTLATATTAEYADALSALNQRPLAPMWKTYEQLAQDERIKLLNQLFKKYTVDQIVEETGTIRTHAKPLSENLTIPEPWKDQLFGVRIKLIGKDQGTAFILKSAVMAPEVAGTIKAALDDESATKEGVPAIPFTGAQLQVLVPALEFLGRQHKKPFAQLQPKEQMALMFQILDRLDTRPENQIATWLLGAHWLHSPALEHALLYGTRYISLLFFPYA
jgi:hypothetical protein